MIELDTRRLLCPMPVIKLQNKIKTVPPGTQLHVICSDPGTLHDIPTWCRLYGHKVLSCQESAQEIHFIVEVT